MPTLNDKDQKRLSGFGLLPEIENAVSEVWSTGYGSGNLGYHVSLAIIVSAVALIVCDSTPSLSSSVQFFVWMAFILSVAFSVLGMLFVRFGSERHRLEEDTGRNRKLFLSRTFLNHVFAKGFRKHLGSIAVGMFAFALVSAERWGFASLFFFSAFVLSAGIGVLELRTIGFLKMLEERLSTNARTSMTYGRFDFDAPTTHGHRRFAAGMNPTGMDVVDVDFVEVPRRWSFSFEPSGSPGGFFWQFKFHQYFPFGQFRPKFKKEVKMQAEKKNQTPRGTHPENDEPENDGPSGPDSGFGFVILTFLMHVALFVFMVYMDALPYGPTVESVAVSACGFAAIIYVEISVLIILTAIKARLDSKAADILYLSDTAKKFAYHPHSVSLWIEGFIHALVFSILVANGHTNTAGFLLFASLALIGSLWLISKEVRKHISSNLQRGWRVSVAS